MSVFQGQKSIDSCTLPVLQISTLNGRNIFTWHSYLIRYQLSLYTIIFKFKSGTPPHQHFCVKGEITPDCRVIYCNGIFATTPRLLLAR